MYSSNQKLDSRLVSFIEIDMPTKISKELRNLKKFPSRSQIKAMENYYLVGGIEKVKQYAERQKRKQEVGKMGFWGIFLELKRNWWDQNIRELLEATEEELSNLRGKEKRAWIEEKKSSLDGYFVFQFVVESCYQEKLSILERV